MTDINDLANRAFIAGSLEDSMPYLRDLVERAFVAGMKRAAEMVEHLHDDTPMVAKGDIARFLMRNAAKAIRAAAKEVEVE